MARPQQISDEEILEATLHCVGTNENNFSIDALAEQMKISPQAILKRMGGEEELLIRAFLYCLNKESLDPIIEPLDDRPFGEQLRSKGRKLTQYFHWIERFRALFIRNGVAPTQVVERLDTFPPLELLKQMNAFLAAARDAGLIDAAHLRQVAAAFVGTLGYQCHLRYMFPNPEIWVNEHSFLESHCRLIESFLERASDETSHVPSAMPVEIERKYLLTSKPEIPEALIVSTQLLEQGYIPGTQITERVRRITGQGAPRHVRTVKLGEGIQRFEFEEDISSELFEQLWATTVNARIRKERTVVRDEGYLWEIDRFIDRPLWLAEVELEQADTKVVLPTWLAAVYSREVTDERKFTNWALATQSECIAHENGEMS